MFLRLRTSPVLAAAVTVLLAGGRIAGHTWSPLDTGLLTLLVVTLSTDVATVLAAHDARVWGPWRGTWWAVGLEVFPTGAATLPARMQQVGDAGLAIPWAATMLSSAWFFAGTQPPLSHSGAALLASLFALVTTLVPARAKAAAAGGVLERLLAPRWARANWEWAALIRSVLDGATLTESVVPQRMQALLAGTGTALTPLRLAHVVWCCETGAFDEARPSLRAWATSTDGAPEWLAVDAVKHAAAFFALIETDIALASACLARVEQLQRAPWYAELPAACLAHAQGDLARRDECLARWHRGVDAAPHRQLLLGANTWLLKRLAAQ